MTITSGNLAPFLLFMSFFAIFFLAFSLYRFRVPGAPGRAQVRAMSYLVRYSAALEFYGLYKREIRTRVDEIRADLVEAADRGAIDDTLRGLGSPRSLAASVAGDRLRPSVLRGVIWVGAAFLLGVAVHMLALEAFLGGFEPLAAPGDQGSWSIPGMAVEATMGDDGRAQALGFTMSGLLVLLPIVFVIGARAWRPWRAR